jgi:hypothetical protein
VGAKPPPWNDHALIFQENGARKKEYSSTGRASHPKRPPPGRSLPQTPPDHHPPVSIMDVARPQVDADNEGMHKLTPRNAFARDSDWRNPNTSSPAPGRPHSYNGWLGCRGASPTKHVTPPRTREPLKATYRYRYIGGEVGRCIYIVLSCTEAKRATWQ